MREPRLAFLHAGLEKGCFAWVGDLSLKTLVCFLSTRASPLQCPGLRAISCVCVCVFYWGPNQDIYYICHHRAMLPKLFLLVILRKSRSKNNSILLQLHTMQVLKGGLCWLAGKSAAC